MSWTTEREEKLRQLWKKGHSASQIANMLGDTTRNAVIGKAHRLKLEDRSLSKKTETNIPVPKVIENSKISISPVVLTRIITNIEKVSDYITIKSLSNKVEFSGKGEIGDAKINLLKSDTDLIELHSENETASVYSLEYMAKVIRSIGRASKNVDMKYGESSPLFIEFEMPSKTKVGYYLAPRIEE